MSSHGKQRSRPGGEWERPARQYEAQNLDTLRDTTKAATLARNPQDSEWCRFDRLSAMRLQRHDALSSVRSKATASAKAKAKGKRKGKEKGKSKDKSKERTSDTSNAKCSFCKGKNRPKSLTWPAEKKTMSHELSKLTVIDSDASVHVCSLKHGQGDSLCKSSETRPSPGAEMQQRGMRQMSYGNEARKVAAVFCVLDMRRSIWSLGSMMDSGCDVYFEKDRCWIAKKQRERMAGFGVPGPAARDTLDGDEPSVRIRIPTGPLTPSAVERTLHNASGHALHRRWCRLCAAARAADEPHLREQQPETDEAVSRIEFDSAELEREEDRTLSTSSLNAFDDGSESITATLCSTKAFSEYLAETTLAFVEVLGHNVVMLHSDQEPVLVQLLKTVQSRRFERTSVRHGPKNQSSESEQQ